MNQTINIGIASIYGRQSSLEKVLDSLTNQADLICVYLNGYEGFPSYIRKYSNVSFTSSDENLGAEMKFQSAPFADGYFFGCDDDLVYPDGYIAYMKTGVDKYNGLVSLHGKKYLSPITDFRNYAGNYRCLNTVSEDVHVNIIGSGCCAFHTDRLKIIMDDFKKKNMADLYLSKQATEQGVPMIVLEHPINYLTYLPQKETIWRSITNFEERTEVLKSFIK